MTDKFDEQAQALLRAIHTKSFSDSTTIVAAALRSVATPAGEDVGKIVTRLRQRSLESEGMDMPAFAHALNVAAIEIERDFGRSTPLPASTGYEPNASAPIRRTAGEAEPR